MPRHHTNAYAEHQQSWDMLICHRQTSAGKLRPGSEQLYGCFWQGQHKHWKGQDTSAGGFPQETCWKQRNDCFQASWFHARFGEDFVLPPVSSCLSPSSKPHLRLPIHFLAQQVLTLFLLTPLIVSLSSHSHFPLPHPGSLCQVFSSSQFQYLQVPHLHCTSFPS